MYDENKMPLTPDPAAPAPEQEPDEVVSWYVRPDEGQEITGCYVQPGPMPAAAAPKAVRQEKRRSRKGLWTFLVILAVLAIIFSFFFLVSPAWNGLFVVSMISLAFFAYGIYRITHAFALRSLEKE